MEKQCEKIRESLQGYFEKSLARQAEAHVEAHLKECTDCAFFFAEYERMNELLSKWKAPAVSENFEDNVLNAIIEKETKKNRHFLLSFFRPAFAGIAVFVIVVTGFSFYYLSLPVLVGVAKETGYEEGRSFAVKTGQNVAASSTGVDISFTDGSFIKLEKGSRLFVSRYRQREKICELEGSIKAEIRKYPGQEFIFKTSNGEIRVIGTELLISAEKLKTIVSVVSGSVAVKGRAEKALVTGGNLAVVSSLSNFVTPVGVLDAAKDKDRYVRVQAIKTLLELKGNESLAAIIIMLGDDEPLVASQAASALGSYGSREAAKPLIRALSKKDKDVRMQAAISLGKLKVMDARNNLKWLLEDKEPEVRVGAALALVNLGEKAYSVPAVLGDLDSSEATTRCNAVKILGKIGGTQASKKIAMLLADPDKDVKWYAVRALEKINDPTTFPALLALFKDADDELKRKSIQAASNLYYTDAIPEIALVLRETNSREVKFSALRALGYLLPNYYKSDKEKQIELVAKYINDRDRLIKIAALISYARAMNQDVGAKQKIYEISVKDGNKIVKETAAEMLKKFNKPDYRFLLRSIEIRALSKLKEKAVVPVLIAATKDWNAETRRAAVEGFEELGDKIYLPILYEAMKDSDPNVAEAAEQAVKTLK